MSQYLTTLHSGDSRLCVLTCYNAPYAEIARTTVQENKGEYCKRWGHTLMALTAVDPQFHNPGSHVSGLTWNRFACATELAKSGKFNWIYVVGADTLITNHCIPLSRFTDPAFHLVIANDVNEWNADSMFIRCSPEGIALCEDAMAQYERLKSHVWVEQQALIEVRDRHAGKYKVLPQWAINAYNYKLYWPDGSVTRDKAGNHGDWCKGDFLIHWAGLNTQIRIQQIKAVVPQIVR